MTLRVGFVGLGTMGLPMASNLLGAGFDPMVFDQRPEPLKELTQRGAKVAGSLAEVARHAEVVEIAVAPEVQVEAVTIGADGLVGAAAPGIVIDIHSTAAPAMLQRIAATAAARGVSVLDAQMSGGDRGAKSGTLCFMVGGDREALERARPVLSTCGTIFHLGDVGAGSVAKIAQNTMLALKIMATAEGFAIARRAGVAPEVFQEVIHASAAQSHVADDWLQRWGARESPNAYKWILDSALEIGTDLGLDLPAVTLAKEQLPLILGPKEPR